MLVIGQLYSAGAKNLQPAGQMRPMWTFGMAHNRIFVT